ncbi:MAG: hypothetical protein JO186_00530, partial [Actinobacteria bacterium]|nr:hypothetical protein [Actinomycetota bacterium]
MLARAGAAALELPWSRLWAPVARVSAWVMARPVWNVFVVLLLVQWAVVGVVAAIAQHNGPYYYTGGDATWYWTSAWVLAHGHIPQAVIGYGYPMLLAPIAFFAGPSIVAGMPYVMAFNAIVLWPVALSCVYAIAKILAGRGFAYCATLLWTVFPLVSIPYFYERYHTRFVSQNLPGMLGLTAMGDFPSLVGLLLAAYLVLRALLFRTTNGAVLAG